MMGDRRKKLLKDKAKDAIRELLCQPFVLPELEVTPAHNVGDIQKENASKFEKILLKSLSKKIIDLEEELAREKEERGKLQKSVECFYGKIRNPRKVVTQRDEKVRQLSETEIRGEKQIANLWNARDECVDEMEDAKKKLANDHQRVYYYQRKQVDSTGSLESLRSVSEDVHAELAQSQKRKRDLELCLGDALKQLDEDAVFCVMKDGQYVDAVRKCCLELLSCNVGVLNVASGIRSVLLMVGKEVDRLPSIGLLSQMLVELRPIVGMHVAEKCLEADNITLHSDGTSKFGRQYGSYQVTTADRSYTLGVVDMKCGTALHTLDKLKEALGDVEAACISSGQDNLAKRIIANIKNMLSDRCIVQTRQ